MSGAIFVLDAAVDRQQGPIAALISTAGWASAARRVLGAAWIAAPGLVMDPAEARRAGSAPHLTSATASRWPRYVPVTAKTAARDALRWRRGRRGRIDPDGPWRDCDLAFVWQRHSLFHAGGINLARALDVPSVLFVTAPQVWEAAQWGVKRPGWGRLVERVGEEPAFHGASLIACGTQDVADQVMRLGGAPHKLLVTPTGVDLDLFDTSADDGSVRGELGSERRFVVGWVGSFRRFHAVENAVDAVARVEGATLLLVGDGPERPAVEALARERGVDAIFVGTVPQEALSTYLAAMDVALITASAQGSFHYSPLKLAEYLAASRCVLAPSVGQIAQRLTDGVDAVLYPAGDAGAVAVALERLRDRPSLRADLGSMARATAERSWSWDRQIERIVAALG